MENILKINLGNIYWLLGLVTFVKNYVIFICHIFPKFRDTISAHWYLYIIIHHTSFGVKYVIWKINVCIVCYKPETTSIMTILP